MYNARLRGDFGTHKKQYLLTSDNEYMSWHEVLNGLIRNPSFRSFFNDFIASQPFDACYWETPPLTEEGLYKDFECVFIKAAELEDVSPDVEAFASYWQEGEMVAAFSNLGKDAHLIVPNKLADPSYYPHLLAFVRNAPSRQQDMFWKWVGEEFMEKLTDEPRWLSTSGLGVSWLHVRIDSRPKYYQHGGYKM